MQTHCGRKIKSKPALAPNSEIPEIKNRFCTEMPDASKLQKQIIHIKVSHIVPPKGDINSSYIANQFFNVNGCLETD